MRGPWINAYHSGSLRHHDRCICCFEHFRRDLSISLLSQRCQLYRRAVSNAEQVGWTTSCTATYSLASHRISIFDDFRCLVVKLSKVEPLPSRASCTSRCLDGTRIYFMLEVCNGLDTFGNGSVHRTASRQQSNCSSSRCPLWRA